jgi:asparagine synthase (glutamine-hydrolysing)
MQSADERFVITFNGEIYNFRDLRKELEASGSRFRTESDTEVAMEAFRHWGTGAFSRFRGMWALAIADLDTRRIVLSRDPFGIKPLYFGKLGDALYFASEPKALVAAAQAFSEIDHVSVALFQDTGILDRGAWTFFRKIQRFPHAHWAESPLDAPSLASFQRYWAPPTQESKQSYRDAVQKTAELFHRSVARHVVSDVPIAVCLSGGLDSSAIASSAKDHVPPNSPILAFTARFANAPEVDETQWAAQVARKAGLVHVLSEQSADNFSALLPEVLHAQDEPFGSTSIFAQYELFRAIRLRGIKVALDGQGADEQLGGYHGLFSSYLDSLLYDGEFVRYAFEGWQLWQKHRFRCFDHLMYRGIRQLARGRLRRGDHPVVPTAEADEYESRVRALAPMPNASFEDTLRELTCDSNLPQLLRYADRDAMAHSVEARVPFLDVELVEHILSLPAHYKIRRGNTKAVFRDAMRGVITEPVRRRRDKLGFATPEQRWPKRVLAFEGEANGQNTWRRFVTAQWLQQAQK